MAEQSKAKTTAVGCLFFILVAVLITVLITRPGARRHEQFGPITRAQAHAEFQQGASYVCRTAITHQLNDPDSAEFDPREMWAVELLEDTKIVMVVTLRANNAFGGVVNGAFRCQVQDIGSDYMVTGLTELDR